MRELGIHALNVGSFGATGAMMGGGATEVGVEFASLGGVAGCDVAAALPAGSDGNAGAPDCVGVRTFADGEYGAARGDSFVSAAAAAASAGAVAAAGAFVGEAS